MPEYVIVGGGPAGHSAAKTLVEEGAHDILLLSRDPDPPYDRTAVTKSYLHGDITHEQALLDAPEWYAQNGVELRVRTSATKLDTAARTLTLADRSTVDYGRLLLATGANVHRLRIDGAALSGIHYLRTLRTADEVREDVEDAGHVVLVGGSYIATEVAATLTSLGKRCTIVMQEDVTLERAFGKRAGGFFQRVLEEHQVQVHGGQDVARFEGEGRVSTVVTKAGDRYEADAVVVGAGVHPDVTLARAAGLELGERGGVLVDSRLRASAPGIWAAGDVAEYESVVHGGARMRIEHWDVAEQQGRSAALSMLGRDHVHDAVPYFFSDLADWVSMEYVGPAYSWTEELVRGSLDDGEFTVYYLDGDRLAAALTVGRSGDLDRARELIASGEPVDRAAL
ncbi:NAD(P)/FAD-dependent oxidoreductase, partial [Candidatus Solirubrobacter pratensis]|uniref:NAD(P)/FAD-dependent oxidoreductase n=1 Tax=Candidatus Solirubrobacter pratensis TaxID=1298857 RepID=UPI0003FD81F0